VTATAAVVAATVAAATVVAVAIRGLATGPALAAG